MGISCIKYDRLIKLATMWNSGEATYFHGFKLCEIVHKASKFLKVYSMDTIITKLGQGWSYFVIQ